MNVITDLIFIFIFLFTLIHFDIISVRLDDNHIAQKFYVFIAITLFATGLDFFKTVKRNGSIGLSSSLYRGAVVGLMAYVGHSTFYDILNMEESNDELLNILDNNGGAEVIVPLFITCTIGVLNMIGFLFKYE